MIVRDFLITSWSVRLIETLRCGIVSMKSGESELHRLSCVMATCFLHNAKTRHIFNYLSAQLISAFIYKAYKNVPQGIHILNLSKSVPRAKPLGYPATDTEQFKWNIDMTDSKYLR